MLLSRFLFIKRKCERGAAFIFLFARALWEEKTDWKVRRLDKSSGLQKLVQRGRGVQFTGDYSGFEGSELSLSRTPQRATTTAGVKNIPRKARAMSMSCIRPVSVDAFPAHPRSQHGSDFRLWK
jgi:hypothetical protein